MKLTGARVLCVITGCARPSGFGWILADRFVATASLQKAASLTLIQHARPSSVSQLEAHAIALKQQYPGLPMETHELGVDFSTLDWKASTRLPECERPVDAAILFNNAGVLCLGDARALSSSAFEKSFRVNAIAMKEMAALFLDTVPDTATRYIVHTSSLAALEPYGSMAAYCASKSASDMIHRVLAVENPALRVLQWAPGPMSTAMTDEVIASQHSDPTLREDFRQRRDSPNSGRAFVNPGESAERLLQVLVSDKYRSGDHIDFYDCPSVVADRPPT